MSVETGTAPFIPASTLYALRDFYEAWGHQAVVAGGAVWFNAGSFCMVSSPTVVIPQLEDPAARRLLWETRRLAAIYGSTQTEGTSVSAYVLSDKTYDMNHLQRQFRQHVVKASKHLEVRECSWNEWIVAAQTCDEDTLARRGTADVASSPLLDQARRQTIAKIAATIPDFRIQACFFGREMVAYLVHLTMGSVCEGLMIHRRNDSLDSSAKYASHLVYFHFTKALITQPEITKVCVGRQSIPFNPSLSSFKRHAGFIEEPYHLRFRLHPLFAPAIENRASAWVLRSLRQAFAGRLPFLANLEVLERACLRPR
ncbi:MAG: hypothetical protein ACKOBW_10210 [Planctomycetota bacterium]